MSQTTPAVLHRHLVVCRLNEPWQKEALLADAVLGARVVAELAEDVLAFRRDEDDALVARLTALGLSVMPEGRWRL